MTTEHKPGEKVPNSGIYKVTHDTNHVHPHEVTCVAGEPFPPCRGCAHPRFVAVRLAVHVKNHDLFKP